jgi:hypothetical protein
MSLRRIAQSLSVVAVAGVLAGSSYVTGPSTASGSHHDSTRQVHHSRFTAPVPHKYGSNGMRMGLHCETVDYLG